MEHKIDDSETVICAVTQAMCDFKCVNISSLPPLQESVNVDALTGMFEDQYDSQVCISFYYNGCHISIQDEHITVQEKVPQKAVN